MNTSVDVLEVMRKSANVASMNAINHGGKVLMNFADDCEAAREAVAELIEAVQSELAIADKVDPEGLFRGIEQIKLRAALSRAMCALDERKFWQSRMTANGNVAKVPQLVDLVEMAKEIRRGYA